MSDVPAAHIRTGLAMDFAAVSLNEPFRWRVGESYASALERYMSQCVATTLANYIADINHVNAYYDLPLVPIPIDNAGGNTPITPPKKWHLAEAYKAAMTRHAAEDSVPHAAKKESKDAVSHETEMEDVESATIVDDPDWAREVGNAATAEHLSWPRDGLAKQATRVSNPDSSTSEFVCLVDRNRMVVRGVSRKTTEEKVRAFFADRNINVVTIQLPVNAQTGELLKWMFVDFQTEDAARAAQQYMIGESALQKYNVIAN